MTGGFIPTHGGYRELKPCKKVGLQDGTNLVLSFGCGNKCEFGKMERIW